MAELALHFRHFIEALREAIRRELHLLDLGEQALVLQLQQREVRLIHPIRSPAEENEASSHEPERDECDADRDQEDGQREVMQPPPWSREDHHRVAASHPVHGPPKETASSIRHPELLRETPRQPAERDRAPWGRRPVPPIAERYGAVMALSTSLPKLIDPRQE
jgi:hypothetical protein